MKNPITATIKSSVLTALAAIVVTVGVYALFTGGKAEAFQPDDHDARYQSNPPGTCDIDPDNCFGLPASRQDGAYASERWVKSNVDLRLKQAQAYMAQNPQASTLDNAPMARITGDAQKLPWIQDGVTTYERVTLDLLSILDDVDPEVARSITSQPFLQSHEAHDWYALYSITSIAIDNPLYAQWIVDYYTDRRGGITDASAHVVSVLDLPYDQGQHDTISALLTSGTVELRQITRRGGYAGVVSVVRPRYRTTGPATQATVDAISHTEDLMQDTLISNYVPVLVAEAEDAQGYNNGVAVWIDAWLEDDGYTRELQRTIAHEIGHFWWNSDDHENWLSEGAAEYIGAYSLWRATEDGDVTTDQPPCPYYRSIEHMRADLPEYHVTGGARCNYALGQRLFVHLDRSMDTADFENRFRKLHQTTTNEANRAVDQGWLLMQAFCPDCIGRETLRNMNNVAHVLSKHYGAKMFTNQSAVSGTIPGLGKPSTSTSVQNKYRNNRQYGLATLPTASHDQRRWVSVWFPKASGLNRNERQLVRVEQYHEETEPWSDRWLYVPVSVTNGTGTMDVYLGAPQHRATGHHWVYIYNQQGQKIADAEYQVVH